MSLPSMNTPTRIAVLAVCLMCSAVAWTQSVASPDRRLRAETTKVGLRLEIRQTTLLSDVLRVLCNQANVTCSGSELLSREPVVPMVVEGRFLQLVRDLVDGTDVNLNYTHETLQSRPTLVLRRRMVSTIPTASTTVPIASSANSATSDPEPVRVPVFFTAGEGPTLAADPVAVTFPAQTGGGEISTPNTTMPSGGAPNAAQQMYGGGYAMVVTPSEALPFPAQDGQPVLSKPYNPEYLPFPDEFGRPIPVTPAKPGSPFPISTQQQAPK